MKTSLAQLSRLERDLSDGASSALIGEAEEMVAIRQ